MTDDFAQMMSAAQQAPPPRPSTGAWRVGIAVTLLLVCVIVVLMITMSPTPINLERQDAVRKLLSVLHNNGIPKWFGYSKLEFTANIAMFVPLGLLIGLVLPRALWWLGVLIAPAFSALIELTQALVLSQRSATVEDVIANSIGGMIGLSIAFTIRTMVHARDRRVIAQAKWDERWGKP